MLMRMAVLSCACGGDDDDGEKSKVANKNWLTTR